jgi:hypothetical protein
MNVRTMRQQASVVKRSTKEPCGAHTVAMVRSLVRSAHVLVLVCGLSLLNAFAAGPLHITEFMADNTSTLRDEDGDYSDWIEIYNAGPTLVNLDGWSLTDDVSVPAKWRFPAGIQMAPDTYLVVFASDKDRTNAAGLHTNFKLSAGGEYLGLIDPLGSAASEFSTEYPEQNPDISYGRDAGDLSLLLFFPVATPRARNATGGAGFPPEVEFSRPGGTFAGAESFLLTMSVPSTNAVIYYAFGTNVPGPTTFRYTNDLLITNSVIVRARAFEPGLLPGPIASRTYVALGDSNLVADDLAAGRLVKPFELSLRAPPQFAYHVISPVETADTPMVKAFREWTLREAGVTDQTP